MQLVQSSTILFRNGISIKLKDEISYLLPGHDLGSQVHVTNCSANLDEIVRLLHVRFGNILPPNKIWQELSLNCYHYMHKLASRTIIEENLTRAFIKLLIPYT